MALKTTIAKLNDYYERLDQKKAGRIKASHVEKVIAKLKSKENALTEDLKAAKKSEKKDRIKKKLKFVREQIARAEWLLSEIG